MLYQNQQAYLNPQLAQGPVAGAYLSAMQAELGVPISGQYSTKHYQAIEYLYNLSIATANTNGFVSLGSGELAGIGYLIGYPWPSVLASQFAGTFQFILSSGFPGTNPSIGFSSATSGITYGTFTSANPSSSGQFVSVPVFRSILNFIAQIKWNGLAIIYIDKFISSFLLSIGYPVANGYTINYGTANDIYINFKLSTDNIGSGYLYVLQLVFNRVCTSPQVQLSIS